MDEQRKENSFWEIIKFTVFALMIVAPIRLWVAKPFIVYGASMEPTLKNGDYLIIDEISYKFHEPEKGDIVVFHYPLDPSKYFIKRIIGMPGEILEIDGQTISLEEDEYFVMGDNRGASSDSRIWGPVPEDLVVGRTFVRLWPFNEADILPGQNAASVAEFTD